MYNEDRCKNMNHGRMNPTIKHCPDCGIPLNKKASARCDSTSHAQRRKNRSTYCCDCGKLLRDGT